MVSTKAGKVKGNHRDKENPMKAKTKVKAGINPQPLPPLD
jgi:hypothetical protein